MLKYYRSISLMSDKLQVPIGKLFEKNEELPHKIVSIGSWSLYRTLILPNL
jgi:hypothetical protein